MRTDGDWDFPNRTVLMKNFRVGTRLIETRLLMRHPDGSWGGFTYEWNAQQSDATLVEGGALRDIGNGQNWIFPSEIAMPGLPHAARRTARSGWKPRSSIAPSLTRRRGAPRTSSRR